MVINMILELHRSLDGRHRRDPYVEMSGDISSTLSTLRVGIRSGNTVFSVKPGRG